MSKKNLLCMSYRAVGGRQDASFIASSQNLSVACDGYDIQDGPPCPSSDRASLDGLNPLSMHDWWHQTNLQETHKGV